LLLNACDTFFNGCFFANYTQIYKLIQYDGNISDIEYTKDQNKSKLFCSDTEDLVRRGINFICAEHN